MARNLSEAFHELALALRLHYESEKNPSKYLNREAVLRLPWVEEKVKEKLEKLRGYTFYGVKGPGWLQVREGSSSGSLSNWSAGWELLQGSVEEVYREYSSWSAGLAGGSSVIITLICQPRTVIRKWRTNADGTETFGSVFVFLTEDEYERIRCGWIE